VTSTERYVNSSSQKSEFDKVLDERRSISEDTLSWDILKVTRKHFGDTEENNARKFEAFMGAFIVNAAMRLYDKGLEESAFRILGQAKTVLETKRKLAQEIETIRAKTDENAIDIFDLLGIMKDEAE